MEEARQQEARPNGTRETKTVCLACGKVKGEHRGWDVSCEMNSRDFVEDDLVRHCPGGRVKALAASAKADATYYEPFDASSGVSDG